MVIERSLKNGKISYWVSFRWHGRRVWEHAGTDKREAQRLEARRKLEVKRGTYQPPEARKATRVLEYGQTWLDSRTNRNAESEASQFARYVLEREWFASMPLIDVRPRHLKQLVDELKLTVSEATGKPLSPKTVANIYGNVRTMFRDAHFNELVPGDPCVLPRGTFKRKGRGPLRAPYTESEIVALTTSEAIPPDLLMWNMLAFYTGMREGEVCGRRWRDYDTGPRPLGSLAVATQYDDQPLKTADTQGEQARVVPVHPDLARALEWWWREGWEFVYLRKPTREDFIVPHRRDLSPHTKGTAYKAWVRVSCPKAGVANRSIHSTRHTFISLVRRATPRKDVLERITHNAGGDIVDNYTTWDWAPLCEVILAFQPRVSADELVHVVDGGRGPLPSGPIPVRSGPRIALLGPAPSLADGDASGDADENESLKQVEPPGIEDGYQRGTIGLVQERRAESLRARQRLSPQEDAASRVVPANGAARHLFAKSHAPRDNDPSTLDGLLETLCKRGAPYAHGAPPVRPAVARAIATYRDSEWAPTLAVGGAS